jgi:hypothetical protein
LMAVSIMAFTLLGSGLLPGPSAPTAGKPKGARRARKDPEQSAVAEAGVRGGLDRAEKPLNLTIDKRRGFAFGPRKALGLDLPGRVHGEHSFFGEP